MSAGTVGRISVQDFGDNADLIDAASELAVAVALLPADARRLAACWNACEGLTTEQLEKFPGWAEAGMRPLDSMVQMTGELAQSRIDRQRVEDNYDAVCIELAALRAVLANDMAGAVSKEMVEECARGLVRTAEKHDVVITITQIPRLPLAMGNYDTVVTVSESRAVYGPRLAAEAEARAAAALNDDDPFAEDDTAAIEKSIARARAKKGGAA